MSKLDREMAMALGQAMAIVEVMRDKLEADESQEAHRLVNEATKWLEKMYDLRETSKSSR